MLIVILFGKPSLPSQAWSHADGSHVRELSMCVLTVTSESKYSMKGFYFCL